MSDNNQPDPQNGDDRSALFGEIAALSKVGKGSVYRYFKSKENLLTKLLAEHYENITGRISRIFSREHDVMMQIREMIEVWVKFIEEHYEVLFNGFVGENQTREHFFAAAHDN